MQLFWIHLLVVTSFLLIGIWVMVKYARWIRKNPPDDEDDGGGGGTGNNLPLVDLPPDCSIDFLLTDRPSGSTPTKINR